MSGPPQLSVCIPAYNRAAFLPALLDSIVQQDFPSFEIVICEDCSPERARIAEIVRRYQSRHPGLFRYFENEKNLGYDGNLRRLIERAQGDYCVMMGNDDLMCPGALDHIGSAVSRHDNVGVVVRSYASFDDKPDLIDQQFIYFPDERFFPNGPETIATCYRRSVVISGMVLHRAASLRWATDRYDGTTLYQLFLIANILVDMNAVFLPQILVLYRNGTPPDFGTSEAERGKFVPGQQTPDSSENFMRGMLRIASDVERIRGIPLYHRIRADIDNYSYPILSIQADKPVRVFSKYAWRLVRLGLGRGVMFYVYFAALLFLGPIRVNRLIRALKRRIGHTPSIGGFYKGRHG